MKKRLNYGDIILYPFAKPEGSFLEIRIYSPNREMTLVQSTIEIDHMFPNDQDELHYGLTDKTFKVTIVPVDEDDQLIYGRERTYFSDIKPKILDLNPQFFVAPYPQELIEEFEGEY